MEGFGVRLVTIDQIISMLLVSIRPEELFRNTFQSGELEILSLKRLAISLPFLFRLMSRLTKRKLDMCVLPRMTISVYPLRCNRITLLGNELNQPRKSTLARIWSGGVLTKVLWRFAGFARCHSFAVFKGVLGMHRLEQGIKTHACAIRPSRPLSISQSICI